MKNLLFRLLPFALLAAQPAAAQFLVHDVTANATLKVMSATQNAQLVKAAETLAQSKAQLEQLQNLNKMVKNGNWQNIMPSQLQGYMKQIKGMENFDVKTLFSENGYVDVFMGMSASDYKAAVAAPQEYAADRLLSGVMNVNEADRVAKGGPSTAEVMLGKRLATVGLGAGGSTSGVQTVALTADQIAALAAANSLSKASANMERNQAIAVQIGETMKKSEEEGENRSLTSLAATGNALTAQAAQATIEQTRQNQEYQGAALSQHAAELTLITNEELRRRAENTYVDPNK